MKANLENRIKELEYALEALCNVCLQVDGFELYHVFEAQEVLEANEDTSLPNVKISEDTVAIATDEDGRTFEFTAVPELTDEEWYSKNGSYKLLNMNGPEHWKNSLIILTLDQIKEHNKSIKGQ